MTSSFFLFWRVKNAGHFATGQLSQSEILAPTVLYLMGADTWAPPLRCCQSSRRHGLGGFLWAKTHDERDIPILKGFVVLLITPRCFFEGSIFGMRCWAALERTIWVNDHRPVVARSFTFDLIITNNEAHIYGIGGQS